MNLRSYLDVKDISPAAFARAIKVSTASLYRYIGGDRIPHRDVMARIVAVTGGEVQPNDFFAPAQEAA